MCIKRRSKRRAHDIVHAGIVGVIGKVKSFRCKVQRSLLPQLESAAQSHVEIGEVRTNAGIASCSGRTIIREMSVAVDVRCSQKVEWVAAVVRKDRRELEPPEDSRFIKRAGQNRGDHHLVPLVKIRQRTITLQACCVERRIITIKSVTLSIALLKV